MYPVITVCHPLSHCHSPRDCNLLLAIPSPTPQTSPIRAPAPRPPCSPSTLGGGRWPWCPGPPAQGTRGTATGCRCAGCSTPTDPSPGWRTPSSTWMNSTIWPSGWRSVLFVYFSHFLDFYPEQLTVNYTYGTCHEGAGIGVRHLPQGCMPIVSRTLRFKNRHLSVGSQTPTTFAKTCHCLPSRIV